MAKTPREEVLQRNIALGATSFPWEVTCPPPAGTEDGTRPPKGNEAFPFAELAVSWACSLSAPRRLSAGWEVSRLSHGKQVGR